MQEDINSFTVNCTAPQVEEEHKLYEHLRNWDDEIINQKMEDLGIPNVKLTQKRKYILGMIDSLADIDTKRFFLRNSDFMEIANISKAPFMEAIKYFSKLGIIKRESGVRGKASEYKFNEKNLKKLPLKNQTIIGKKNQTLNGVSSSVLGDSSEYGLGKGSGQKQSVENQPPHTHTHIQSHTHIHSQLQQQLHQQLQEQLHLQLYSQEQMKELGLILSDNNAKLIESINIIIQAIVNTKDETIEELKKISTSIDNNTRVQSEHNTKLDKLFELIEENNKSLNELQVKLQLSSMDNNGKSNGVVQSTIDTNDKVDNTPIESSMVKSESNSKVIEESDNSKDVKESSSKSCGEVQYHSSSKVDDRIMSYQLGLASSNPIKDRAWKREQQKKVDTKTASKSNVGIVQESNSSERTYTLNKLRKEIVEPFKWMISNINDYEKLDKAEKDFYNAVNKLYSNHSNVITKSEIEPFIDEVRTVIKHKEEELTPNVDTNETASKSNVGMVQDSPKEVDKRFHTEEKTAPKAETSEEKEEDTAEPSTADGKATEVPKSDTLHSKEEQEKLDEEVDDAASSIFLECNSEKTPTKKSEEVEFPNVEQIALREEEQKQLQEMKENKYIKPMLENFTNVRFTDNGAFDKILMEIRKSVTDGNYNKKVVQAFLDFSYTTYMFDCNLEDAMKPLEDTKDDTAETQSDEENRSVDGVMKMFPKTDKRFKEDEERVEVIEDSDDEVTDDDMKGVVVGGSYIEENDAIF